MPKTNSYVVAHTRDQETGKPTRFATIHHVARYRIRECNDGVYFVFYSWGWRKIAVFKDVVEVIEL